MERIPLNKPVILSPNHTNGFVDPVTLGMMVPIKVRFFARGDVFKGRLAKWALNDMNISPMYRIQEGYGELKKNDKTFEECRTLLSDNKALLLFPEAICVQEKRLQPLKKGLSRIIFQTEELFDFKKDVHVVPIGLNYAAPKKFRSRFFVNFGEPISVKNFEALYKQDKVKAINDFTKLLEAEMAKLIININNKDNDELVEEIIEIYLYNWMKDKQYALTDIEKQYYASKEIAEMINYHDSKKPHLIISLKEKSTPYHRHLKNLELRDHLLRPENIHKMNIGRFFIDFIIIWFGMPVYIIGLILNYPPYYIAKNFADTKIKKVEFYASVFVNMSMLLWIVYYGIQLLAVALISRNWTFLALYALLIPCTGFYVIKFYPAMKKIFGRWRLLRIVRKDRDTLEKVMTARTQIITEIEFAKKEYVNSMQN